jgi:NDP-hexose-3-ketoreductase
MRADPDVRVTAIASRRLSRAAEFTDRLKGAPVEGYDALLDRDDVDRTHIPLPDRMHAEW